MDPSSVSPGSPPDDSAKTETAPLVAATVAPDLSPPLMHNFFVGPDGLRPGWRALLFLLSSRAIYAVLGLLLPHIPLTGIKLEMVAELGLFISAWLPGLVFARAEGRTIGAYGLPARSAFGKMFWLGGAWGIASISLLLGAMSLFHAFDYGSIVLSPVRILKFAIFWGVFFVIVALYEEFLTRGYTLFTLTSGTGFWLASTILSTYFAVIHLWNPDESALGIGAVFVIGMFFCFTLRRTGTLWFAVGFHATWDWGESFLYSVPDSGTISPGHLLHSSFHGPVWVTGGKTGPEGSVLVFALFVVVALAFHRAYPTVRYPVIGDSPPEGTTADSSLTTEQQN